MHQIRLRALKFSKFQGGACPRTPLVVCALGAQLGRYTPHLSPPVSLLSTSTFFEKENPAQCEKEQGNPQVFLGMFYWFRVQCFLFCFFSIKLYITVYTEYLKLKYSPSTPNLNHRPSFLLSIKVGSKVQRADNYTTMPPTCTVL